ncbi:hypothetical protein DUI87_04305 [Hirundo rustica rustica]|uniref:GPI inositol-deacylase n=1 Tax=Hirundo rustica rustica TaxID=333673 RepID=A0A3M0KYT1_HIRRU|nr:hypothetical protein DUI87_04305 [Hirundo rustica rustica]
MGRAGRRLPALAALFYGALAALVLLGVRDVMFLYEDNRCSMTYMYEYPEYLKIKLPKKTARRYPAYELYLYGEGSYAEENKNLLLTGIPVLFLPGNAGSYKQVRSLGSIALRKAEDVDFKYHFNFFSVNFNEELVALYGGSLQRQTKFVHECIKVILKLYGDREFAPSSVAIVGHSMGGLVARALLTLKNFKPELINLLITQATPHVAPVMPLDRYLTGAFTWITVKGSKWTYSVYNVVMLKLLDYPSLSHIVIQVPPAVGNKIYQAFKIYIDSHCQSLKGNSEDITSTGSWASQCSDFSLELVRTAKPYKVEPLISIVVFLQGHCLLEWSIFLYISETLLYIMVNSDQVVKLHVTVRAEQNMHNRDSGHSKETSQNCSTHTVKAQSSVDSNPEATESPSNSETLAEAVNSLKMHITILNLFTWIVLLNLPSLIYWLKNLRYNVRLDPDPCRCTAIILVCILEILMNSSTSEVKSSKLLKIAAKVPLPLSVAMLAFGRMHLYRVPHFVTFSLLLHVLCCFV